MLHVTPATLWQFVIRPKKFSRTNGPFVIVDVTVFIREKRKKTYQVRFAQLERNMFIPMEL